MSFEPWDNDQCGHLPAKSAFLKEAPTWHLPFEFDSFLPIQTRRLLCSAHCHSLLNWIMEKAREFQKNIYFCFIGYAKAFDCVDHSKLENSERDGNSRAPDLPLEKPICKSGSNS